MPTNLGYIPNGHGLLKVLDLSSIPNGTDLHGLLHWSCYRVSGSPTGMYEVRDGEINSLDNTHYAMALWGDPTVAHPGHCVRAELMSANWSTLFPGLCANGALDHSEETRCIFGNVYEIMERVGTGDYGEGFPISGVATTPGQPLTNGNYYEVLFASVQNPGVGNHARGGEAYGTTLLTLGDTNIGLSTGINSGVNTYPGILQFASAGARWRNYRVYKDYRLTVRGLTGSQAFRLYNAAGSPVLDSAPQSGGEAHVNIHLLSWPYTGHIQVFDDNTWATPTANGRFPQTSGNWTNFVGGDIFDQVGTGERPGILINFQDDKYDTFPDEWLLHAEKDVTPDLVQCKIRHVMANPRIEADTCLITLRDPTGKYVPGRTESPLYPNVKLEREGRVVLTRGGMSVCRFYGHVKEYQPVFPKKTDVDRVQKCIIRLESPLRQLIDAGITIQNPPSGVLVASDGTGVVQTLLSLASDIFPPESMALEPTDVTVVDGFLSSGMSLQAALEQCCIIADAGLFIKPHYRINANEPNFYVIFRPRTTSHATADHAWVDTANDFTHIVPRFTGDDL